MFLLIGLGVFLAVLVLLVFFDPMRFCFCYAALHS